MSLSVIIPSKNFSNLRSCVEAVNDFDCVGITIIDDGLSASGYDSGSTDYDHGACFWGLDIIPGVKPFIFARNCNLGIAAAGTDDVILLNDDALLKTPGGFTAMQKAAEEHPEFGIIGAVTNVTGQPLQRPQNIGLREVPHFAFVCVLIPRRTIERVGLLDERYCLDYGVEDRDYCEAVRRAGLKVGVFDGCYVDHGSLTSSFRGDPRTPRSFAQNYKLFQQKWGITN